MIYLQLSLRRQEPIQHFSLSQNFPLISANANKGYYFWKYKYTKHDALLLPHHKKTTAETCQKFQRHFIDFYIIEKDYI